jgi:hypothetical protein
MKSESHSRVLSYSWYDTHLLHILSRSPLHPYVLWDNFREEIVDMSADQDHGVCEFLCRHFVGADEEMRQQCTKQQHSEEKQHKSGILGTISGGGVSPNTQPLSRITEEFLTFCFPSHMSLFISCSLD